MTFVIRKVLVRNVLFFNLVIVSLLFSKDNFVSVKGKNFYIGDEKYFYLGVNMWYGVNLGSETEYGNRKRLLRELDHLRSLGINNLRIMGASEGAQFNTVRPSIQPMLGQYDENVLIGLDFLLDEMSRRNMYAVIFLNNYWVWSGGMSQYVSWITDKPVPNPFKEEYSWDEFMEFSARFYSIDEAQKYYRNYIEMLLNRKNTINGKLYREDPTIMAWQLANEPRPRKGKFGLKNFEIFKQWIFETAAYIKSIDPDHLVSIGNEGLAGCMESEELYLDIHNSKDIDYMTFHLWVLNWGWFDPQNPEATYFEAEEKAVKYIQQHIDYAEQLGKPTVLEEFGFPRDGHSYSPFASTVYRNHYYQMVFETIYQNSIQGGPLVASNFWIWAGEGKPISEDHIWRLGDPYTGDPPQEPQGRNSIFNTDSTTLGIIKEYSNKMNNI